MLELWRAHEAGDDHWDAAMYLQAGVHFRGTDPLLAHEVLTEGLSRFPGSHALQYQHGLTLARLGFGTRAMAIAVQLESEAIDDLSLATDVSSFIARLHKDRGLAASTPEERREHLEAALARYKRAYAHAAPGLKSYPAINAATLSLVTGHRRTARRLAADARALAEAELQETDGSDYWRVATIAEASLVLGEMDEAADAYKRAVELARGSFDDIGSMRRNARLIASMSDGAGWIEDVLRLPSVVVFTGHMIDSPGRARARFPVWLEEKIGAAIEQKLEQLNAGFGFAGAACGGDILFHEAMLKRGQTHVVLPFDREEFRKTSVDFVPDSTWSDRYDRVLEAATDVQVASGAPSNWGGIVFEYANLLLLGYAQLKSRALDTEIAGLAVWDGGSGDGPGGTASTVKAWRDSGLSVDEISPLPYLGRKVTDGT